MNLPFLRKRERQILINTLEHPGDHSYLTREELQKGIVLLPCVVCKNTMKHKMFEHKPYTNADPWTPLNATCQKCGKTRKF